MKGAALIFLLLYAYSTIGYLAPKHDDYSIYPGNDHQKCFRFEFESLLSEGTPSVIINISQYDETTVFIKMQSPVTLQLLECEENSIDHEEDSNGYYLYINYPRFINCSLRLTQGDKSKIFTFLNVDQHRRSCTVDETERTTGRCPKDSCRCQIDRNDRPINICLDPTMEGMNCDKPKLDLLQLTGFVERGAASKWCSLNDETVTTTPSSTSTSVKLPSSTSVEPTSKTVSKSPSVISMVILLVLIVCFGCLIFNENLRPRCCQNLLEMVHNRSQRQGSRRLYPQRMADLERELIV